MKSLVVYYSNTGNTEAVAKQIQQAMGADIFSLEVVEAYPKGYNELVDYAKKEIKANGRPRLKAMPKNLSEYDIIFVGTPNWWSTIAPPLATFLSSNNFAGKTIIPFVTHGGGGMADCETDIIALCPKAKFVKGIAISGSTAKNAAPQVQKWLKNIKAIR